MQARFEVQRQVAFETPTSVAQAYAAVADVRGILLHSAFVRKVTELGAGEYDCRTGVGPLSGRWCASFDFEPGRKVRWTTKAMSGAGIKGGDLTGEIAVQALADGRSQITVRFSAVADASVPRLLVGHARKAFEKLGDALVNDFCEGIRVGLSEGEALSAAA